MRKTIDFEEVLINKVKDVMSREGHRTFTSAVFSMLNGYYNKNYFNKYKGEKIEIIPKIEYTPEQKCEMIGGKVIINNGIESCKRPTNPDGSMYQIFPLTLIDNYI